jgi:hypothetical protein
MSSQNSWWKKGRKGRRKADQSAERPGTKPIRRGWWRSLYLERLEDRVAPTININYSWLSDNFNAQAADLTLKTAVESGSLHILLFDNAANSVVVDGGTPQDFALNDVVQVTVNGGPLADKLGIDFSNTTAGPATPYDITVNFSDGPDNSLKQDSVTITGTGGYHPQSFTLTSDADVNVLGQLTTVGDIHITDAATPNVTFDQVQTLLGLPRIVEISEATITVGTGMAGDTSSLTGNNVDLEATSTINTNNTTDSKVQSLSIGNIAQVAPFVATSTAHVNVLSGSLQAQAGNLTVHAESNVTATASTTPTNSNGNATASDAAVAISIVKGEAGVLVSGGMLSATPSATPGTGQANITADNIVNVTVTADGTQGGSGGGSGGAGASLGLSVLWGNTTAEITGGTVTAVDVTLAANSNRTATTTANATQGGSKGDGKPGSDPSSNASEQTLTTPNPNSGNDSKSVPSAQTSDSNGTALPFAAAVAVGVVTGNTTAFISGGFVTATDSSATGGINVAAHGQENLKTTGDGSNAAPSGGSLAIGAGVAIGVSDTNIVASLGDPNGSPADLNLNAKNVNVQATADGPTADGTIFDTEATSGASDGNVGVAGSLAINVPTLHAQALVADPGKNVNVNGANLTLMSTSTIKNTSNATAKQSGGSSVGVGASVALNVVGDTTSAQVQDTSGLSNVNGLSMSATAVDAANTTATAGASGGTAVAPSVALGIVADTTTARLGTASNSALTIGGAASISAGDTQTVTTKSTGTAQGSNVAVGAAIALNVVHTTTTAVLARGLTSTGLTVSATTTAPSDAEATASLKGEDKTAEQNKDGVTSADGQASHQSGGNAFTSGGSGNLPSASSAAGTGNSNASGQSGTNSGDSGGVGVAAALGVNVATVDNEASINSGGTVDAGTGAVMVSATTEMDGTAKGTGTGVALDSNSTNISAGVGFNWDSLTNKAFVDGSTTVKGTGITVQAVTMAMKTDSFVAWGAAAAGTKGNVDVAGSVGLNVVTYTTEASVKSGSHVLSKGNLNVNANTTLGLQTLAGGAAFNPGNGTVVGGSIAIAIMTGSSTKAFIEGNADAAGAMSITADTEFNPLTVVHIPLINQDITLTTLAVAGGATTGDVGVAAAAAVNVFSVSTWAYIGPNAQINNDTQDITATPGAQSLTIHATDNTTIRDLAGSLGLSSGSTGVGAGLDVNVITKDTRAYIGSNAMVSTNSFVTVMADATNDVVSVVANGTGGSDVGVSVGAAVYVFTSGTGTHAYIDSGAHVTAGGDVSITATSPLTIKLVAGSLGFGGTAGVGADNTTLVYNDTVEAYIGNTATISTAGSVGLTIHATASEDVVTVAAGAAVGGDAAVVGSASVNVLNDATYADIGQGATIIADNGANPGAPGIDMRAKDTTTLVGVAGSLAASGTAGVGLGADVESITKHTLAYIESNVTANDVKGDILVNAQSSETFVSVAAGVSISGSVSVGLDASVHVFNVFTRAFIGDDPRDELGLSDSVDGASAGPDNVHAKGSVVINATDDSELNKVTGVLAVGGYVGVGAAGGVTVFNKTTEAFIGAGANVSGDGNTAGPSVNTGQFQNATYDTETSFNAGSPAGQGIEANSSSTVNSKASDLAKQGHISPPGLASMNSSQQPGGSDTTDPSFSGDRSVAPAMSNGFHGVAVTATNHDTIRSLTIALAGGTVGIAIAADVNVVKDHTRAYVGGGAMVDQSTAGANSSQTVLVGASNDFYHLGVAGSVGGGVVGVAPAADVTVVGTGSTALAGPGATPGDSTTEAFIANGATVNALGDVKVGAHSTEDFLLVGFGVAGGLVGVGAAVSVLSVNDHVWSYVGSGATVFAGGNVVITSGDDTTITTITGALAGGFVGVGGAVGVLSITKDTQAYIDSGSNTHVDAEGTGSGVGGVLDGTITPSVTFEPHSSAVKGVIVQAQSTEHIFHLAATAAGGFVGVAGGVTVTLINSHTQAYIGSGAQINQTNGNAGAGPTQGVYVVASNEAHITTFAGALAGGAVGVSGGIDVGELNNNTSAEIDGKVAAKGDVEVNALGIKDLRDFTFSGAVGLVGVTGAFSVWSIGAPLQKSYQDNKNNSDDAANPGNKSNSDADANAASQSQSTTDASDPNKGGVTTRLNAFDSSGNANSNQGRLKSVTSTAASDVGADRPSTSDINNSINTPPPAGTSAGIGATAIVSAGGNIQVKANEHLGLTIIVGGIAGGAVGVGAAVSVANVADNATAHADGTLSAGLAITVAAVQTEPNVTDTTFAGAAGIVGLGASVAVVHDNSTVQAYLGGTAQVTSAGSLTISTIANQNFTAHTDTLAAGGVALGASFTRLTEDGQVNARVDGGAKIGQQAGQTVGSLNVNTVSNVTVNGTAVAVSVGAIAGGANFAFVTASPTVESRVGTGTKINTTGDISVTATSNHTSTSYVQNIGGGLAAVGASLTEAHADGSTTAHLDGTVANGSGPGAGNLTVKATSVDTASAVSQGTTGGILSVTNNDATATVQPTVSAYIASSGVINASSNIDVEATENPEGDALTKGVSGGVLALGGSDSTSTIQLNVTSYVMASSVHAGTGQTNNITVNATAAPIAGNPPDYTILSADPNTDTLQVRNHSLHTGDVVVYDPGHDMNGTNNVIGGLQATAPTGFPPPHDTQPRQYDVINVDKDHLAFGATFDGAGGVDPTTSTIHFTTPHNFQTGDQVVYVAPTGMGMSAVGGLSSGTTYFVLVVDPLTIKLTTYDPRVVPSHNLQMFTPATGTTLSLTNHGFTTGEPVTYHAPAPDTFGSLSVNVTVNGDGTLARNNGTIIDTPGANNIYFGLTDANGNPAPQPFTNGDMVNYSANGTVIGGLTNGHNYKITGASTYAVQLAATDTLSVTFNNNGMGQQSTIVRSDGGNWTTDGFQAGQTITVSGNGANDGPYTIASVSADGSTIFLTATNTGTTETDVKTIDSSAITLTPVKTAAGEAVVHNLVNVGDLPMTTGGVSMDGKRFYVINTGNDSFQLADTLAHAQAAIPLPLVAPLMPTGHHQIGPESIDLSAGVGPQVLQIALTGSTVDTTHGPQKIEGPGGVPLNVVMPPIGTGISSVLANGSGGGLVAGSSNSTTITDNPTVKAYVSTGLATAGGNVSIASVSTTHVTASAQNGTGGLVGIGDASSESDQTVDNEAYVDTNTRIIAGQNFTLSATTTNQSDAATRSSTGGVVSGAGAHVHSTILYTTKATINSGGDVLAAGAAQMIADTKTSQTGNAHASGIGFGGDGHSDVTLNVGGDGMNGHPPPSLSQVEVGSAAALTGSKAQLSATVSQLNVQSHAEGYGAGFVAIGTGSADDELHTANKVLLDSNAAVTGYEGVDFRVKYDGVNTDAFSFARATGLFGVVHSDATNNTHFDSEVTGTAGAFVTAGPRDPADPAAVATGLDHLAFYIDTSNGSVSVTAHHDSSKRSLATGGDDGHGGADMHGNGAIIDNDFIDFSSDVLILSGRSPFLVINKSGNIDTAVNVTVNGGNSMVGSSAVDGSGTIHVDDITNNGPGDVYFSTGGTSSGMITDSGGPGHWEFRDTYQQVRIINNSTAPIQINNISVVNTSVNPIVDLINTLTQFTTMSLPTMFFHILRSVAPTFVDIESTNNAAPAILENGTIENPIGVTRIYNAFGNIQSTNARDVVGSDGRVSLVRTNILDLETPAGSIGQSAPRVNVDIVDSAAVPRATSFLTARVSSQDGSIFLGRHQFFTGEVVQYTVQNGGTALGGLISGDYYAVIASPNGLSIQLANITSPSVPITIGSAIPLDPTVSTPTTSNSLLPVQRFTVVASGNAYLDVKDRARQVSAQLRSPVADYSVIVDAVNTGGDANVLLQPTVQEIGVSGTPGDVDVAYSGHPRPGEGHHTFFNTPDPAYSSNSKNLGVFGSNPTAMASTYDFRNVDTNGNFFRPGIVSGHNIIVTAANSQPTDPIVNVYGLIQTFSGGAASLSDQHHVNVLTNGYITLRELSGDLRVGSITSTGNPGAAPEQHAGDVTLFSPAAIIDAQDDFPVADVTGRNITMTAGDNQLTGTSADMSGRGGIGTPGNFLEIHVNANGAPLGVLNATDTASATNDWKVLPLSQVHEPAPTGTYGIFLTQTAGDMEVGTVITKGDVSLATVAGSIVDARMGGAGLDSPGVIGNTIDLYAKGGNIGTVPTSQMYVGGTNQGVNNDLKIESQAYVAGTIGARADNSIYLTEVAGSVAPKVSNAYNARVVLMQAVNGNVRFTVRDSSQNSAGISSDLNLLPSGSVLFLENAPETITHGLVNSVQGSVLLRVGDNVTTDLNAQILAGQNIDIFGDFQRQGERQSDNSNGTPETDLSDPGFGTIMHLQGTIAHGPTANGYLTRIFGNNVNDQIFFDQTFLGGTNPLMLGTLSQTIPYQSVAGTGGPLTPYPGGKTRAYGSNTPTPAGQFAPLNSDGNNFFVVNELQTMNWPAATR